MLFSCAGFRCNFDSESETKTIAVEKKDDAAKLIPKNSYKAAS